MNPCDVRRLARTIYGTDKVRSPEPRAWLREGVMAASQAQRLGRRDKPPCFSSEEQWVTWCILEAARPIANSGFCYDCMPAFKTAMLNANKCEHPLTSFKEVGKAPDTDLVGQHPNRRRRSPRR